MVMTTPQLHSTKPELRFFAGSNPASSVSEICDGEDLWQWSWLEIRLNAFCQTIPEKQFIIICSTPVFTSIMTMVFNFMSILIISVFLLKLFFANEAEFCLLIRFLLFNC